MRICIVRVFNFCSSGALRKISPSMVVIVWTAADISFDTWRRPHWSICLCIKNVCLKMSTAVKNTPLYCVQLVECMCKHCSSLSYQRWAAVSTRNDLRFWQCVCGREREGGTEHVLLRGLNALRVASYPGSLEMSLGTRLHSEGKDKLSNMMMQCSVKLFDSGSYSSYWVLLCSFQK